MIAAALFTPYAWCQQVFASRIAHGPYAAEFLTYAAATGDLRTVEALASHGASVAATSADGQTSLGAAAVGNQPRVIAYLLDRGLSVNTLNASGDSPLDEAIENHSVEASNFLKTRGAVRLHGTPAQHDSVARATVERAIKRMDSIPATSRNPDNER